MPKSSAVSTAFAIAVSFLASTSVSQGRDGAGPHFLSDQGYTGYVNTPSAFVTPEGRLSFLWSDAVPSADTRDYLLYDQADNYLLSIGMFPRLEFSARLTNSGESGFGANANAFTTLADGQRDLSTNAKLNLWSSTSGLAAAVGLQDASGNGHFTSTYGVLSYRFQDWEGSIGYATGRMDGLFYGMSRRLGRFVRLTLDDDSVQRVGAIDVHTASLIPGLTLVARYRLLNSGPNAEPGFSAGIEAELGRGTQWRARGYAATEQQQSRRRVRLARLTQQGEEKGCSAALYREAQKAGLDRAHLATMDADGHQRMVFAFDARRYAHSPADATGVALGLVASVCNPDAKAQVVAQVADDGAPKFWVAAVAEEVKAYFAGAGHTAPQLAFGLGAHPDHATLGPRDLPVVDVQLGPELRYTVATEVGILDYSAGVRTRLSTPLWWGASFDAVGIDSAGKTDDFNSGGVFGNSALKSEWIARSLVQTVPLWGYGALRGHYGRSKIFDRDRDVTIGELVLYPFPQTGLQLETRYSSYELRPRFSDQLYQPPEDEYSAWTGSVRYMFGASGTLIDLTWGRYHYGDEGAKLRLERFFGDTGIAMLYLRDREAENEALSVQVSIPFGGRQTAALGPVAIGSNPGWATGLTTIINAESNFLRPNLLREVLPTDTLGRQYLSRYRLSRSYLQASWPRMRDAFEIYVSDD